MAAEICTAIKCFRQRATIKILNDPERRAARKGKIEIKARYQSGRNVAYLLCLEACQSHGRVDIIKGGDAAGPGREPLTDGYAIGNVRAENDQVGIANARG